MATDNSNPATIRKTKPKDYELALRNRGIDLKYNSVKRQIEIMYQSKWQPLTDIVEGSIMATLKDDGYNNRETQRLAIQRMALANAYNPLIDYFSALKWDEKDHIGKEASYFTNPDKTFSIWLPKFSIGVVRRVIEGHTTGAGPQNRMLGLIGPQNIGKSTYARNFLPPHLKEYSTESAIYPNNKDHRIMLGQVAIWEVPDFTSTTRKRGMEEVKAFMTKETVKERHPYDRQATDMPALASFIGTANDTSGLFYDASGYRRFMTSEITAIDFAYSKEINRDDFWAQAVMLYNLGESPDLSAAESKKAEELSREREVENYAEAIILKYWEITKDHDKDFITSNHIMDKVSKDLAVSIPAAQQKISEALLSLGAKRKRKWVGPKGNQKYLWVYTGIKS